MFNPDIKIVVGSTTASFSLFTSVIPIGLFTSVISIGQLLNKKCKGSPIGSSSEEKGSISCSAVSHEIEK